MLLRFDDVDSKLKNTMNENKRLRISLDAVKEKLARQEKLTGERIKFVYVIVLRLFLCILKNFVPSIDLK